MSYSRRNFLKAAGSGVVLTAVGGESIFVAAAAPALLPPMTKEKGTFVINGKLHVAEYEARTTLWEVIAVKAGLTGTNRSCNRASCGACSVLVDGIPIYSCHTLATEASGKKILTIEGVGDEKNMHPLQRIGHTHVAADCGFCTAGWIVTAKALLDKNRNPSVDDVKGALAGHICRCAAYPAIIRTVMDSAAVLRGEKISIEAKPESIIEIHQPMVRDFSTSGGHLPGNELVEGPQKTITKKWQGYPPENLHVLGKAMPALPEVSIPRFTGKAQYASRVWFPEPALCEVPHLSASARQDQKPGYIQGGEDAGRGIYSHVQKRCETGRPHSGGISRGAGSISTRDQPSRRSSGHRCRRD